MIHSGDWEKLGLLGYEDSRRLWSEKDDNKRATGTSKIASVSRDIHQTGCSPLVIHIGEEKKK